MEEDKLAENARRFGEDQTMAENASYIVRHISVSNNTTEAEILRFLEGSKLI